MLRPYRRAASHQGTGRFDVGIQLDGAIERQISTFDRISSRKTGAVAQLDCVETIAAGKGRGRGSAAGAREPDPAVRPQLDDLEAAEITGGVLECNPDTDPPRKELGSGQPGVIPNDLPSADGPRAQRRQLRRFRAESRTTASSGVFAAVDQQRAVGRARVGEIDRPRRRVVKIRPVAGVLAAPGLDLGPGIESQQQARTDRRSAAAAAESPFLLPAGAVEVRHRIAARNVDRPGSRKLVDAYPYRATGTGAGVPTRAAIQRQAPRFAGRSQLTVEHQLARFDVDHSAAGAADRRPLPGAAATAQRRTVHAVEDLAGATVPGIAALAPVAAAGTVEGEDTPRRLHPRRRLTILVALDAASVAIAGHVDHSSGLDRHRPARPEFQGLAACWRQRRTVLDGHVDGGDLSCHLRLAFENQRFETLDGVRCLQTGAVSQNDRVETIDPPVGRPTGDPAGSRQKDAAFRVEFDHLESAQQFGARVSQFHPRPDPTLAEAFSVGTGEPNVGARGLPGGHRIGAQRRQLGRLRTLAHPIHIPGVLAAVDQQRAVGRAHVGEIDRPRRRVVKIRPVAGVLAAPGLDLGPGIESQQQARTDRRSAAAAAESPFLLPAGAVEVRHRIAARNVDRPGSRKLVDAYPYRATGTGTGIPARAAIQRQDPRFAGRS